MKYKTKNLLQAVSIAILVAGAGRSFSADPVSSLKSDNRDKNIPTVITSNKLDFDYEEMVALFDGNVVVKDQKFTLKADRMIVFLEKDTNEIKRVDASGKVHLTTPGGITATCGKATYTSKNGQIIIQIDPVVKKDSNVISGKKMSVWLNEERVVVEEDVALEATPQK